MIAAPSRMVTVEIKVEFAPTPEDLEGDCNFYAKRNATEFEAHVNRAVSLFAEARYGRVESVTVRNVEVSA